MQVLAVEPYYGGSHQTFLDGVVARSRHDWTRVTGPARHWKWRMRSAPLTLAMQAAGQLEELSRQGLPNIELVFCTDMLDLPQWLGLMRRSPLLAPETPVVAYFHENQWTYPTAPDAREDFHYGYTNLLTALTADAVWFNSRYHLDTFWDASEKFIRRMPDGVSDHSMEQGRTRSIVVSPGFDPPATGDRCNGRRTTESGAAIRIGWVSRWEADKRPDRFVELLDTLTKRDIPFELVLLGARPNKPHPALVEIRSRYSEVIRHDEYAIEDYAECLSEMDVVVSTADHEFFGIAVCEAIWAGAIPVLPNRLSYPELVPTDSLYDSIENAVLKIAEIARESLGLRARGWASVSRPDRRLPNGESRSYHGSTPRRTSRTILAIMTSKAPVSTMRVLDANANRAAEGLRTLEETARFVLEAAELQYQMKSLRHDLALAIGKLPRLRLLASRDTPGDIGTRHSTDGEQSRPDASSLVVAAASRTQQALRCLEEYGKTVDVNFPSRIEQIRYRCYDAMARLETLSKTEDSRRQRLENARLYALIDGSADEASMVNRIRLLADSGIGIIQLRDRTLDDRTLYERASVGAKCARSLNILWIVNDRADIAVAANADGLHVGQEELPVAAARRIIGAERLIGLSTHDLAQVGHAMLSCADYIGCGPTFPGTTKRFDSYPGCDFLKSVSDYFADREVVPRPAFAIGGITVTNVDQVMEAGFDRVAVTGALADDGAVETAKEFLQKLGVEKP